jgi:Rieske Fe-S protein
MADLPESLPRRRWLLGLLEAAIAVTGAAILYPVVRFLRPRAATSSGALEVVAPYLLKDLRPDAQGNWPAPFNFAGKPCLLVLTAEGKVRAFNAVCTHLECTVEFRSAKSDIFCPCHNGVYDLNGHNVSGPPPRPLEEYKVALRGSAGQEEILVSRTT